MERQTHTNITIGNARRGPMKFDIVGQLGAIRKAKQFIDGEFIDRSVSKKTRILSLAKWLLVQHF